MKKGHRIEKGYMIVCSFCGSISWIDEEEDDDTNEWVYRHEIINELENDGSMLYKKDLPDRLELLCDNCEKPNEFIQFVDVPKAMRIKIYNMDDETRIAWVQNFWTVQKMKKDNEED